MNKRVVLYESHYGSTETYAQWIGDALNCECKRIKDFDLNNLNNYDTIIYGGGMYAVGILGLKKLKRALANVSGVNVFVFAVGLSTITEKTLVHVRDSNLDGPLKDIPLFMLRGKFDIDKVSFKHKLLMKALAKKVKSKNEPLTDDERGIVECVKMPVDAMDKSQINSLIKAVNA
jgi:flavodoxin